MTHIKLIAQLRAQPTSDLMREAADMIERLAVLRGCAMGAERMLADCVPGGSSVDPQSVCNDIRTWLAQFAAADAGQSGWRTDDPDLMEALSNQLREHPQLKAVIGREALILRCVHAALAQRAVSLLRKHAAVAREDA